VWLHSRDIFSLIETNSLVLSPTGAASDYRATQELPNILWDPNVHYRVHKSPLLVTMASHMNPVHPPPSASPTSLLMLSTQLHLDLPTGLFPSDFSTNNLHAFLRSHSRLIFLDLQTNSVAWVRELIMPAERPSLVGEVSANLCG
jgi:hypothetical protein